MTEPLSWHQQRAAGMHALPYDIVAYTYAANLWCPEHIIEALPMGESQAFDGWAVADEDSMTTEQNLNELAAAFGVDREKEWTFDSDYFPKVVLRDQLKDDEGCAGAEHTCQNLGPQCNGCDMDPYVPSINQHYGDCPLAAPMMANAQVVWSPEQGWHDGPEVTVGLDDQGRLITAIE